MRLFPLCFVPSLIFCRALLRFCFVSAVELRAGGSLTFKIWESGQHQAVALPPRSSMDVRLQGTSARFLTNHAHTLSQQNFAAPKVAPKEQNESVDLRDELRTSVSTAEIQQKHVLSFRLHYSI